MPSASPLSREIETIRAMEKAGAAAVVLESLFEEQIQQEVSQLDHYLEHGTESFAEALSYFPAKHEFRRGPEEYLEHVTRAKESVKIPIIASLNGVSSGGWIGYAKKLEEAGADAIELNVYFIPTDPDVTGARIEQVYLDILRAVKSTVRIPVAMKLSPQFSALSNMAKRLDEAGANGLVLFNRFYSPDIDLEELCVVPKIVLSQSHVLRLSMRWIAILYGRIKASLAASNGVHTAEDVLKALMAGADITMMCSALLRSGPQHIAEVLEGVRTWLEEHEYESVEQLKGSVSQRSCAEPAAFERANYVKTLRSYAY